MWRVWCSHIVDSCNGGQIEMSDDNVSVSFSHPGICLKHYDREGNPNISDVMHFTNEVRNVSLLTNSGSNGRNHIDFLELIKDRLIFVVSTELRMTREFYDKNVPKWPIKCNNHLGYFGNSSLTIDVNISVPGKDIPLVSQSSSYALVDRETRRSKPFTDWYKMKYGGKGIHPKPLRVETLTKPLETFHRQNKVVWTETDGNNHTNYATYVLYTVNSLRAALNLRKQQLKQQQSIETKTNSEKSGMASATRTEISSEENVKSETNDGILGLRGISQDIVQSGLRSVRICYTKESFEGDLIDVYLWQEEGDDLRVKAILESEGDTLCHIHLEYFGTVASHL